MSQVVFSKHRCLRELPMHVPSKAAVVRLERIGLDHPIVELQEKGTPKDLLEFFSRVLQEFSS